MKLIAKEDHHIMSILLLKGGKTYDGVPIGWENNHYLYLLTAEDGELHHFYDNQFFTTEEWREMKLKDLGL